MTSDRRTGIDSAEPAGHVQRVPRIPEHLRTASTSDGATVLDIVEGKVFRLNFVASRIVDFLKQGLAETEIAEQLARDFEIEQATAEADVREFLETLEENRLLTSSNRSSLT